MTINKRQNSINILVITNADNTFLPGYQKCRVHVVIASLQLVQQLRFLRRTKPIVGTARRWLYLRGHSVLVLVLPVFTFARGPTRLLSLTPSHSTTLSATTRHWPTKTKRKNKKLRLVPAPGKKNRTKISQTRTPPAKESLILRLHLCDILLRYHTATTNYRRRRRAKKCTDRLTIIQSFGEKKSSSSLHNQPFCQMFWQCNAVQNSRLRERWPGKATPFVVVYANAS